MTYFLYSCLIYKKKVFFFVNSKLVSDSSEPVIDEMALNQLLSMGFPEIRCKKALIATRNTGAENAMNWLFEHMDDPGINMFK